MSIVETLEEPAVVAPQQPPAKPAAPPVQQPIYTGTTREIFFIVFKNLFLNMLTSWLYRFWGKTNMRRYLWCEVKVMGERFAYTGTGMELFKSFLKFSLGIMFPVSLVLGGISALLERTPYAPINNILHYGWVASFVVIMMYAKYSAARYKLSRTTWRSIRFELRGDPWQYVWIRIKNALLNALTLGLYKPTGDMAILDYVVNRIYFGHQNFTYKGHKKELQNYYYKCWALAIPTLGTSLFWYRAKYIAHIMKYVRFGNLEFRCKITGKELVWMLTTNILMIVGSLGFAYPYVVNRRMKFIIDRFKFRGEVDFAKVRQTYDRAGSEGATEFNIEGDDFGFGSLLGFII